MFKKVPVEINWDKFIKKEWKQKTFDYNRKTYDK